MKWAAISGKVHSNMRKMHKLRSPSWCPKYHAGICSPVIDSVLSNDSVNGLWRSWSDACWLSPSLSAYARRHVFAATYTKVRFSVSLHFLQLQVHQTWRLLHHLKLRCLKIYMYFTFYDSNDSVTFKTTLSFGLISEQLLSIYDVELDVWSDYNTYNYQNLGEKISTTQEILLQSSFGI